MPNIRYNDLSAAADIVAVAMLKGQFITTNISHSFRWSFDDSTDRLTIELVHTDREEFKKIIKDISDSIK